MRIVTAIGCIVALVWGSGCAGRQTSPSSESPVCETTFPTTGPDPGYRVVVDPEPGSGGQVGFPPADSSWSIAYVFVVPPLPCAPSWNHLDQVFYVWGDLDWDSYGSRGAYPLSEYRFNQIVPQATIGNALTGNDAGYRPKWDRLDHWIIQAQYFWMKDDGTPYAQAGEVVPVSPGDEVTTTIEYDADSGTIRASIGTAESVSSIVSDRPFPNESPPLFSSWRDFFERADSVSPRLVGRPVLNVETHHVDEATICSTLPFEIREVTLPYGAADPDRLEVRTSGTFSCGGGGLAQLSF